MASDALSGPPGRVNGLATYFSIVPTPKAAFAQLARTPMWGWAAVAGIVLTLIGSVLAAPATAHFAQIMQQQRLAQLPADQRQQAAAAMAASASFVNFFIAAGGVVTPWIVWLVTAAIFLAGAALLGGQARWKLAWVAAVNAYVISAIAAVIYGIILRLRGPLSVNSTADVYVLPSLSQFVHGSVKLAAFLAAYNVMYIWYYIVAIIALEQILKLRRSAAIGTGIAVSLLSAGYAALVSR
ncbi:MAG: YIP1 family protein [Candidatus Eremiobacteraeota bacterium]|nr:YIP1 family protein [Candidatus Eremiobacteraeota bacterium]MBC5827786.1 YIP1 family protein [Candidatus Eremiobacteraeota bacterium]